MRWNKGNSNEAPIRRAATWRPSGFGGRSNTADHWRSPLANREPAELTGCFQFSNELRVTLRRGASVEVVARA